MDRIPEGRFRDMLHGVPLGHPLHPPLVQVPIGAWTSAALLDLFPRTHRAATALINVGIVTALPAALAGTTDWSRQNRSHQRVGLVHAAANGTALGLYLASSLARIRGRRGWGRALAFAGLTSVGVSSFLGGHIAYHMAGGANQAAYAVGRLPGQWRDIGALAEFPQGRPTATAVGDVPVVVVRSGTEVSALVNICAHMGAPLSQGELRGACLVCPWHGSAFRLSDGEVVGGPASASQPTLQARVRDGRVSVRRSRGGAMVPRQRQRERDIERSAVSGTAQAGK
ncbi:hypothetical protein GCM10022402_42100 [Salinactinospora qingdaonensis]|uniref:Rieske domain-containing protein n=1 Tax=Salinactinospora qingdaonensis TaxID=702744 RepID=A0ABP7G9C6_9ACTN